MDQDKYKGSERRKFTRIPFSFPVRIVFCGYDEKELKEEGSYQYAFSKDISIGGMQLKLEQKPNLAKYLKLKITLPIKNETKVLEVIGHVLWTIPDEDKKAYTTGIQFIDLHFNEKKILKEFIEQTLDEMHY